MNKQLWVLSLLLFACPAKEEPKPVAPPPPPVAPPPPPETPPPPPPSAATGPGTISGVIAFKGTPPAPEKIDMKKDPKCIELNKEQAIASVNVHDGKLADVFVHITEGLPEQKWEMRSGMITMDQKGCVYAPQMIAIQVDQTFKILNSDPLLHNVHAHAKRSEFNQAMPKQGMTIEKKFKTKDLEASISCEVHPWMHATLRVLDHPFFAVTGADGSFTIAKVPAGKYKVELEHAKLGKKTMDVEVTAGGTATVNAEFGG